MQMPIANALIIISLHTVPLSQFAAQQCRICNLAISQTEQTIICIFLVDAVDMYAAADKSALINYCPFEVIVGRKYCLNMWNSGNLCSVKKILITMLWTCSRCEPMSQWTQQEETSNKMTENDTNYKIHLAISMWLLGLVRSNTSTATESFQNSVDNAELLLFNPERTLDLLIQQ